jgi:hypothetical protein
MDVSESDLIKAEIRSLKRTFEVQEEESKKQFEESKKQISFLKSQMNLLIKTSSAEKPGPTTARQIIEEMKVGNKIYYANIFQQYLEELRRHGEDWWPVDHPIDFPVLGTPETTRDKTIPSCQGFVTEMIEALGENKRYRNRSQYDEIDQNLPQHQERQTPNTIVDAHKAPSFSRRKPDIVVYKETQRGTCAITMLGEVKGYSIENEFNAEEVGQIYDMTTTLLNHHQFFRNAIIYFLTDGNRFQYFRCSKQTDKSFSVEYSNVFLKETGWQVCSLLIFIFRLTITSIIIDFVSSPRYCAC